MFSSTQLDYLTPPLGPGTNNYNNVDESSLQVFPSGGQRLTGTAISTVFNGLIGSSLTHETNLGTFAEELGAALFTIQVYDNSQFVGFGTVRRIHQNDIVSSGLGNGYGVTPYNNIPYPAPVQSTLGVPITFLFGEIAYIYVIPSYESTGLETTIINLMLHKFASYVGLTPQGQPLKQSKLMLILPSVIPSSPLYNFSANVLNGTIKNNSGAPALVSSSDFSLSPYHGINVNSNIFMYDGSVVTS